MQLRECVNDLKSKLYTEVQNYQHLEQDYQNLKLKKDMLIEILNHFETNNLEIIETNSFQIGLILPLIYDEMESSSIYNQIVSCIYSNDYEKTSKKIQVIKTKLTNDLQNFSNQIKLLSNQLSIKKVTMIEYRRILSNFKYLGLITPYQIELITKVMQQYNYDEKDQIRIFESIRMHNIRVKFEDKSKISNTVVNMLDCEYKKYEIDQLDDIKFKSKFQTIIDSFFNSIKIVDSIDDVIELMPELESGNYEFDEFDYIYKSVINRLIGELEESISSISDPEIYNDIELRKVVIQEYNENKFKFGKLQYSYNTKRQAYLSKLEQSKELETIDDNIIKKTVIILLILS